MTKRKPIPLRESKVDFLVVPRKKSTAMIKLQMHRILDLLSDNKIVAIYVLNPTTFLSKLQMYTPQNHFLVNCGNNFYYVVRYYSFCNLKP